MVWSAPCIAAPADTSGTLYSLVTPPSALEVGCQDPCTCPVVATPTFGSFSLVRTGSDPLYTHYAVERFIASFNNGPGAVAITGSGQYLSGGEVALVQQLTLDLVVQGGPAQHFDSGLVPVSAPFPVLDVSCSVHGLHCFDSVLVVHAKPAVVVDVVGTGTPFGLRAVMPNPSRGVTSIAFTLDRPGTVELTVIDLAGRRVRTLAGGDRAAGLQETAWDGRSDDGRAAPAGVYWVVLRAPGRVDRRRFVRLD
jgi:hypothetical protein